MAPALMSLGIQSAYAGHYEKAISRLKRAASWAPVIGEQPIFRASLAIAIFGLDGGKMKYEEIGKLIEALEIVAKERHPNEDNGLYGWAITELRNTS